MSVYEIKITSLKMAYKGGHMLYKQHKITNSYLWLRVQLVELNNVYLIYCTE
jgi:hypothetical protein